MKNLCLLLSAFCVATTNVDAAKEMSSNRHEEVSDAAWCASVYTGGAFSMTAGINNPSAVQFNQGAPVTDSNDSTVNDGDNSKLGKMSSFIGLAVGRQFFTEWLHASVSYEFYTPFNYNKYNTGATLATGPLASPVVAGEILADHYDRSFQLNHQSALFNLEFCLPENWSWDVSGMNISPVLGGGVGVGVNTVTNFQAVGWRSGTTLPQLQLTTLSQPKTKAGFAWQVNAGFNFRPEDSDISFSLAYRFYEGGKFATQSVYMLNDATNIGNAVELSAWTGKLRTNQFVMCLDFQF